MAGFGDIREVLQHNPSHETWQLLTQGLLGWFGSEPLPEVVEYCKGHLSRWPDDLPTFAPTHWFKQDAEAIAKSPLTPLFVYAGSERTSFYIDAARETLTGQKKLAIPKFLKSTDLGDMRWRTGEVLDEDDRKRLIVWMREGALHFNDPTLEHMRQFLNDEDCQRWSSKIYKAWKADGEKSAHKWAFLQVAFFGKLDDISMDQYTAQSMSSSGRSARVQQFMEIQAYWGARDHMTSLGEIVMEMSPHYSAHSKAAALFAQAAKEQGLSSKSFLDRGTDYFAPQIEGLFDPDLGEVAASAKEAMVSQIELPVWKIRASIASGNTSLCGLIFSQGNLPFRFDEAGNGLDAKGKEVIVKDIEYACVAHPATIGSRKLGTWSKAMDAIDHEAPFAQLDHPCYSKKDKLLPDGAVDITNGDFFTRPGDVGDNGFAYDVLCIPRGRGWWFDVDVNFSVSLSDGTIYEDELPLRIDDVSVQPRFGDKKSLKSAAMHSEIVRSWRAILDVALGEVE